MDYSGIYKQSLASAMYRIVIGCFGACLFLVLFYTLYPPKYIANLIASYYALTAFTGLCLYCFFAPQVNLIFLTMALKVIFVTVFLPLNWYFVAGAWLGEWRLIDSFPPVIAFIIICSIIVITLLHSKNAYFPVGLSWLLQAIPVISYLIFHTEEMLTPRGLELLAAYGPTTLFMFVVIPHQKEVSGKYQQLYRRIKLARREADRDALTDLLNRRGLNNWFSEISPNTPVAIFMAQVEFLSDSLGSAEKDRVLVRVAARLRVAYDGEFKVARWGMNEFVIIMIDPFLGDLENHTKQFKLSLDSMPLKSGLEREVSLSVGASDIGEINDFTHLLTQADDAMLADK